MSKIGPFAEPIPKEVLQSVLEIVRSIEISEIRLVEAAASTTDGIPSPATAEFSAEHQVLHAEREAETLTVRLSLRLKVKAPEEAAEVLFGAVYRLVYSSAKMSEMPEEGVAHFANTNSVHNAWPYWREFVQGMAGRMGLPLLTLPLFKLQPPPKVETKAQPEPK